MVGRPTANSVTLSVVAGARPVTVEVRVEPVVEARIEADLEASAARDLTVGGLEAGREYRYTVTARGDGREEVSRGRFVTRRRAGSPFTFALLSDTHLPAPATEWMDPDGAELFLPEIVDVLGARAEVGDTIRRVMESIREREVDFIVCLGDMVHYWHGFNDPFAGARAAEFAYLDLRAHFGRTTAETAFFAAVGNWDGESGW